MTNNLATESGMADDVVDQTTLPHHSVWSALKTGTGGFNIVGRRKLWYTVTAVMILISLLSIGIRGFTLGIDFKGGSSISLPAAGGVTTSQVEKVYSQALGKPPVSVQTVGSGAAATISIQSDALSKAQADKVQTALFDAFKPKDVHGKSSLNAISTNDISSTWGGEITKQALIALGVFVVLVAIYIAIRFERDMALSALASLFFNLVVTAGIYSLVGFEVTPAAVIGLLTILGYVLYDNVVVFDKVEENTRGVFHRNNRTYGEQTNLAINQTLMRSINTTVIGVLPIIGLLVIAVWLLGVGALKDLALVQLVGMIVGAFSSIFFATPLLVSIKERWGPAAAHTRKVYAKRAQAKSRSGLNGTQQDAVDSGEPVSPGYAQARQRRAAPSAPRPGARPAGKRSRGR